MGKYLQIALPLTRFVAVATQCRTETTLQSGNHTFHLPALTILAAVEPPSHLSAVALAGPTASAAGVERDHCRADAQVLASHAVVGLRVIAGISQQAVRSEEHTSELQSQ